MSNDSSSTDSPEEIKAVPWKAWLGVLFVLVVFFASQLFSGAIISIYPLLKKWSESQANDWLNGSVSAQFLYLLITEALILGAIYLFLRMYKLGFASIGLIRPRWRDPLYGLAAVLLYFPLYLITLAVVTHFVPGLDVNQKQELGFDSVHGLMPLTLTFVSLVLLPAVAEEIMVRGFLYSSLKKAMPTIAAVLTTSAIFAAAHLPEGGATGPLYIAALDTFVLSLVLIYLREKTGSLWPGITLHAIKNSIAFVALFALHL